MKFKDWVFVRPLLRVFLSSKFIVLFIGVLAVDFGLDISDGAKAVVTIAGAALWAGFTAWEDASQKRNGG